jgi:hypothetical protein
MPTLIKQFSNTKRTSRIAPSNRSVFFQPLYLCIKLIFLNAIFEKDAVFAFCKFRRHVDFGFVFFNTDAFFQAASFLGGMGFFAARFFEKADFSSIVAGPEVTPETFWSSAHSSQENQVAIADFRGAEFLNPKKAIFHQVNGTSLAGFRVRFAGASGLENISIEDVRWNRSGRRPVLEDELDLRSAERALQPGEELTSNYEPAATAYRKLVRNFDGARHFAMAEDCFCGEMEVRRCDPRNLIGGRFRQMELLYRRHRLLRALGRFLSIANAYRFLSYYGSNYIQAFSVLVGILMIFVFVYPFFGLRMIKADNPATNANVSEKEFGWASVGNKDDFRKIIGAALWVTLDEATFRKNPTVEPSGRSGRRIALVEQVSVPAQLALLLLSLRRRFRR